MRARDQRVGVGSGPAGGRGRAGRAERAVALLVALAAAARAGIVAAGGRRRRARRARPSPAAPRASRVVRAPPRAMRRPIATAAATAPARCSCAAAAASCGERAIASEKCGGQRGDLVRRHDAAEIEQAVEAERPADRIGGLEREAVGERLGREADAVFALEQRPERAADRRVLGVDRARSADPAAPRAAGASAAKSRRCPRACRRRARTTSRRCSRSRGTRGPTPPG